MEVRESDGPVLSDREIEELRARVRKELETEEEERVLAQQRQQAIRSAQSLRIREIEREEEEKFYAERGYRRFLDRAGNARWLSPEQAARWEEERVLQQRRRRRIGHRLASRKTRKVVIFLVAGVTLVLFALFLAFLRRG
jgi:hypothetical protein